MNILFMMTYKFIKPVTPSHDYKLQIEAARSVAVLPEYSR
jgi:hypothetical protein